MRNLMNLMKMFKGLNLTKKNKTNKSKHNIRKKMIMTKNKRNKIKGGWKKPVQTVSNSKSI